MRTAPGLTRLERKLWRHLVKGMVRAAGAGDDRSVVALYALMGRALGTSTAIATVMYLAIQAAGPWRREAARRDAFFGFSLTSLDGRELDVDDAPYAVRWAARMVSAAVNGDEASLYALAMTARDDGQMDACVPALARMAAERAVR
ncbi:hypothetical protein [Actinomadura rayongensis]|uniref:Uncharacterized protein n=1 Tax=Actinomadura rayongensis TaxID=1429076 RepID=A0A6I4WFC4_9ACTN|nr:hypothetical protein [Actinomadura rayongensis]MXQ67743.1 hypothetical protein [Actinomadura rayongensis]